MKENSKGGINLPLPPCSPAPSNTYCEDLWSNCSVQLVLLFLNHLIVPVKWVWSSWGTDECAPMNLKQASVSLAWVARKRCKSAALTFHPCLAVSLFYLLPLHLSGGCFQRQVFASCSLKCRCHAALASLLASEKVVWTPSWYIFALISGSSPPECWDLSFFLFFQGLSLRNMIMLAHRNNASLYVHNRLLLLNDCCHS